MPIVCYRCEKCSKEYRGYKEAKSCENSHLYPVSAKAVKYTIRPFPYEIEVTFNNGDRRIYTSVDLGGGMDYYPRKE